MEQYKETLKANLFLQAFKNELQNRKLKPDQVLVNPPTVLVGGAVIDILRGVIPKDYDFIHNSNLEKIMRENLNFKLEYTSRSAITFSYNGSIIQLLYKSPDSFAYTLEQSRWNLFEETLINFDEQSFLNKVLVPTKLAFESRGTARVGVKRLLHWQNKGWNLQNITFQSLCDVAFKDLRKCKSSEEDEDEES